MKNIWTQHLERSNREDQNRRTEFTRMLHSLVKMDNNSENTDGTTLMLSGSSSSTDLSFSVENNMNIQTEEMDQSNETKSEAISATETELGIWTAKSQKGHELGLESLDKDYVKLLMTKNGKLFLRYDVVGESPFEMTVRSEEEALQIIKEDNETTEQLYPDNPELKWIKIT